MTRVLDSLLGWAQYTLLVGALTFCAIRWMIVVG